MSKTFRTVGSGSTQTTEPIENNKIPIYDTKTDAESDLANLTVGQIIATKDEGNETSTPVDVVEDGNMHAVTSNAVAESVSDRVYKTKNILNGELSSDYSYADFDLSTLDNTICNVMVVGNANRVYLGKFEVANYNGNYSIILYYGPNLTVSVVDNKVRVSCSDSCYEARLTYFAIYSERERILQ